MWLFDVNSWFKGHLNKHFSFHICFICFVCISGDATLNIRVFTLQIICILRPLLLYTSFIQMSGLLAGPAPRETGSFDLNSFIYNDNKRKIFISFVN